MKYYGLPCPVCGAVFNENDDVVVCPECATPHHRECWLKNGRCVNVQLHSETFVWSPDSSVSENGPAVSASEATQAAEADSDSTESNNIVCHICGSENPADALHCGGCGALFGETDNAKQIKCPFCGADNPEGSLRCSACGNFLSPNVSGNPFMNGISDNENEKIGGYTVGDYALYVQLNAKRYIPKFRKITNKKLPFNWAAFLFGPQWFLFRKLYKAGIFLLISFIAVSMMCTPLLNTLTAAFEEVAVQNGIDLETTVSATQLINMLSEEAAMEFTKRIAAPTFAFLGIMLAERLLCGFLADILYYKKVRADLKLIDNTVDDDGIRRMMVVRRGSVSFLAYFAGNLGEQVLINLFIMAADKLSTII